MKQVHDIKTVSHLWANKQQDYARNSFKNFYFDGDTIYSYGSHFPIAKHFKDVVLFTLRSYSNTTAKHISYVRSAASHLTKVYCKDVVAASFGNHSDNVKYWLDNINRIAQSLPKAKKPEKYFSLIEFEKSQLNAYLCYFGIKLNATQLKSISFTNVAEFKDAVIAAQKEQAKADEAKLKAGKKVFEARNNAWHNNIANFEHGFTAKQKEAGNFYFQSIGGWNSNTTMLRFNGTEIETSKGIKMPVDVAKRYYSFYKRIVKAGGCNGNCNYKMLDYTVASANESGLVIGCHNIDVKEINAIALKMNW